MGIHACCHALLHILGKSIRRHGYNGNCLSQCLFAVTDQSDVLQIGEKERTIQESVCSVQLGKSFSVIVCQPAIQYLQGLSLWRSSLFPWNPPHKTNSFNGNRTSESVLMLSARIPSTVQRTSITWSASSSFCSLPSSDRYGI